MDMVFIPRELIDEVIEEINLKLCIYRYNRNGADWHCAFCCATATSNHNPWDNITHVDCSGLSLLARLTKAAANQSDEALEVARNAIHGEHRKRMLERVGDLPAPSMGVMNLLNRGKKISAIKLYRNETGLSLVQSKYVIDYWVSKPYPR